MWIGRREILRPDQTFFFTIKFDREQGPCSSRQPCKRCRSSTRAQESKNIWDLSESGLGQEFNFLDDEKVSRRREKSKLVIAHLYFITNIFLRIFIQMVLLVHITIKIRDTTKSSASSSAMERSFEKLSMQPAKTSVSAGHSALQNSWTQKWKKKIRLWSTLFSSPPSNDTCGRVEDFAATWRKKREK